MPSFWDSTLQRNEDQPMRVKLKIEIEESSEPTPNPQRPYRRNLIRRFGLARSSIIGLGLKAAEHWNFTQRPFYRYSRCGVLLAYCLWLL